MAFAVGILVAELTDLSFAIMSVMAGAIILTLTYCFERQRGRISEVWFSAVLLFLMFLAGLLRMGSIETLPLGAVQEYEGKVITVHGRIRGIPIVSPAMHDEWRIRYETVLDSVRVDGKSLPRSISGGVMINVKQHSPMPTGEDGDSISAAGTVRLFHSYHNPGQPDWTVALAARGMEARIAAVPESVHIIHRQDGEESLATQLGRWRNQVRTALVQAMPDKDAALIMGMLFGGYDGIERTTVRNFATTGIVHILSVSGAHIALVAGGIFWLSRRLSVPENWSAGVAAIIMVGYGMLSGFSAPVIRSVIMGLIAMAAIGLGQQSSASRALLLAVIGMLIYEPRNLFDISFQLSIGCTAGLLFMHHGLAECLRGSFNVWLPRWIAKRFLNDLAEGLAATLAAQLAVIPFLSWYFGTFPIISLFANLLVVPILELVILLGLGGILLAGASAAAAHPVFIVISLLTGLAVEINRLLSRMPWGSMSLPAMGIGLSCLYYGLLICSARYGNRWKVSPRFFLGWLRDRPWRAIVILLFVTGLSVWICFRPGQLQVHFIDVGQGDATLVITPHGKSILVDTGGALGVQNNYDIGERVVVPYLRHYGVKSIDWMILTHNHQDHAGGAAAVAEILGVRHVLLRQDDNEKSAAILRLQQAMHGKGMQAADDVGEIQVDGVKVKIFQAGEEEYREAEQGKGGRSASENGRSNVPLIEYGRHSFLLTGDLEGESEKKLVESRVLPITVLKVGHHGARKSTQNEFLAKVTPQYAIISVGADNQFGHPAPETLHRLQEWPVSIYRTDLDGAVVFRSDGETLTVERTVH